jgi:hypothetical protein
MSKTRFGYIFVIRDRRSSGVQEEFERLKAYENRRGVRQRQTEPPPAAEPPLNNGAHFFSLMRQPKAQRAPGSGAALKQ